jgi:hypothetical protein
MGLKGLPHRKMKLKKAIAVERVSFFSFPKLNSCAEASANPSSSNNQIEI